MSSSGTSAARVRLAAALVAAAVALVYSLIALVQWRMLEAPSWDLGIFSQLAKAYSTGSAPIVPIKGEGYNLLGDHFHPILVLLGPVWWLWPSPLALLVLQAVLFGVSTYPITRLAIERLRLPTGVALGLAYGFAWGLQFAINTQFHEIAFAVPLLAFGLVSYLRGDAGRSAIWIGALVFVKEDLGLTVAAFGVLLALCQPRRPRLGWGLAAWGVVWTVLTTLVILPAFNVASQYDYTGNVASLSGLFVPIEKWITVALLICLAGGIGLRSPIILLMLPTLAWRFAGSVEYYWDWRWHYSAVLVPIAIAALLDGIRLAEERRWPFTGLGAARSRATDAPAEPTVVGHRLQRPWPYAGVAVYLSAASTLVLAFSFPALRLADLGSESPRMPAALAAIDAVPEGARVETDLTLMARLVPGAEVYWMGDRSNPLPEYVVFDMQSHVWRNVDDPDAARWATDRYGIEFELIFERENFQVARPVTP